MNRESYSLEDIMALKHNSQLTDIANYLNTPIATYTHSSNPEVVVSSVNVETNTFTSVGHGLVDGNTVYPVANLDAGNIHILDKFPTGLIVPNSAGYYVVGKTDDTFQLSLTSGGAAIDLTTNANMDLTKWHFEKPVGSELVIDNLPNLTKATVKINGRFLSLNSSIYAVPNEVPYDALFLSSGAAGGFVHPRFAEYGANIDAFYDLLFDYTLFLTIFMRGVSWRPTSTTEATPTYVDKIIVSPAYSASVITSIKIAPGDANPCMANGLKVEVYKA